MPSAKKKIHDAATLLGRKGGKARAAKLTPARRKEIASKAARVRWRKAKRHEAGEDDAVQVDGGSG